MAGHNEPHLLYSIGNINAYHIRDGKETSLTPDGAQTLSLLMVPTSSPFADLSNTEPQSQAPEEDFYLHIHLPPDLDISLPATTQIYHQPPRSYLIPRWDLGPDSAAFTRLEFPKIGDAPDRIKQEDIDTFETILAQCTAFLEHTRAPPPEKLGMKAYNPGDYAPGEGYIGGSKGMGQIVLIDEENGSVVGELKENFNLSDVKPGSKNPVEISLPADGQGNQINVHEVSEEYLKMSQHPAYQSSSMVQNAATASRLIVTGAGSLASMMSSGASNFTQRTKPNPKPMTFSPAAQDRIRKINKMTHGAVGLSASTVGQIGKVAQNIGAHLTRRGEAKSKKGDVPADYKPGVLNKSMIAFSTIADGIEQGAKDLLTSGSAAASTVVGHRYGSEAGQVAGHIAGGIKNVGLVYVDATGVSRRAVLKSVAKGMVVGRVAGGGEVVVGAGDGGQLPPEVIAAHGGQQPPTPVGMEALPGQGMPPGVRSGHDEVGFGTAAGPPAYGSSGVGESLHGQSAYPPEKHHYR